MTHIYLFYALQLASCWFAVRVGGRPERLVALVLLGAALASTTNSLWRNPSFASVDTMRVAIDLALLAALVAIAAVANRFWPLWIAALHLIAIAVHGVRAYDPSLVPWMYAAAVGKIAYPMLALLVAGAWRHRRRVIAHGAEPDWTPRAVLLP